MTNRKALDMLLQAIYLLREEGASRTDILKAVEQLNHQFDADLAGLQMLQEELGQNSPRGEEPEQHPRVSVQPPPRPR